MSSPLTLLIVDDSKSIRLIASAFLSDLRPHWTLIDAPDGETALEKTKTVPVDAALLDLNMPGMGGFELAEQLHVRFPKAHLAILAANIQKRVEERAVAAGYPFLQKPLTSDLIAAFVDEVEGSE
jgi:CheY-like chemotaxis protein